jgi:hypothetical protein
VQFSSVLLTYEWRHRPSNLSLTLTLIQLRCGAYAPARMEIAEDVVSIPANVTIVGQKGISALRAIVEDILDWPLAEGTDFRFEEPVHMRYYPTVHGRGASTTYGIILELGRHEINGSMVYP